MKFTTGCQVGQGLLLSREYLKKSPEFVAYGSMQKDFSNQRNVNKQEVAAAIAQLKAKNWDINAYTVADELHIQRSALYRNPELMDLITEARSQAGHVIEVLPEQAIKRATMLEQVNHELEERAQYLELEIADHIKREQEAWHLGHKAGLEEGLKKAIQESVNTEPKKLEKQAADVDQSLPPTATEKRPEEDGEEELPWAERPFMSGILNDLVQKEYVPGTSQSLSDFPLPKATKPADSFEIFTSMQGDLPHPETIDPVNTNESKQPLDTSQAAKQAQTEEDQSQNKTISQEELADLLKKRLQKDPTITGSWAVDSAGLAGAKFVSAGKPSADISTHRSYSPPAPPHIRKACLMLGLRPEELTIDLIHESWKREITKPGTHPDHGGDTEMAMYLNTAKDALLHWLEAQSPKLGKKFGINTRDTQKPTSSPDEHDEPTT